MDITIRRAKDGMYDVWEGDYERWLFTTGAPRNLLTYLDEMNLPLRIKFVDVEIQEILEKNKNF